MSHSSGWISSNFDIAHQMKNDSANETHNFCNIYGGKSVESWSLFSTRETVIVWQKICKSQTFNSSACRFCGLKLSVFWNSNFHELRPQKNVFWKWLSIFLLLKIYFSAKEMLKFTFEALLPHELMCLLGLWL